MAKYKLEITFSGKAIAELDELKSFFGVKDRGKTLRKALRWSLGCVRHVNDGGKILVKKGAVTAEVVFTPRK